MEQARFGGAARLPRSRFARSRLRLVYPHGRGTLRAILTACTAGGFTIAETAIDRPERDRHTVILRLTVEGRGDVPALTATLSDLTGVVAVASDDGNAPGER